jgi:hypothetical protein
MTSAVTERLIPPSAATLAKYGLTMRSWLDLARRQGGVCGICQQLPKSCRLVIDHEHAVRWKHMPPGQRALYVRGLLCWFCNHYFCGRGITVAKSRAVTAYLLSVKPFNVASTTEEVIDG